VRKAIISVLFTLLAFHTTICAQTPPPVGLNPGNMAPDIVLQTPSNETLKLSSLRGKMVLIDFWASWCGPCRHENPTLVKAFYLNQNKSFKDAKGFAIYSVSLDVNPAAWKNAIMVDGLVWSSHVSDLKGWSSAAAQQYGVQSIPTNFLVNGKGIIVATNLRGQELLKVLEKNAQP
jgi:thiol-disulfide isomerase/thioredoxin